MERAEMKSLLICPAERNSVAALGENAPLAVVPFLGKTLVDYWLEHLAAIGAKEILILADDRAKDVAAHVSDGARWGLRVTVQDEIAERTIAEARAKFKATDNSNWLAAPDDVILMDHLPQQPDLPLFTSYANWFAALVDWLPRAATPERIGRILKLGVWAGLRTRIAPTAELHAPVFIGDNVRIGDGAIVGPNAVIEEKSFIEPGAKIADSHIGAETFVGAHTDIENSIALGNTLINWKYNSVIKVPDEFLLCSIVKPHGASAHAVKAKTPTLTIVPAPELDETEPQPELSWKYNAKTGS
jgi:NDP-sugar pyrophosphorylase family protein